MANDYEYRRGGDDRDYNDDPYSHGQFGYGDSYYSGYGGVPLYRGYHHRGYYNEPYRSGPPGRHYDEPYGVHDFGRYEYGDRSREPYSWRGYDKTRRETNAGRGPRGYRRSDERVSEDVNDRLTDDWLIDASDIEVRVKNGIVTLVGRVDSREQKRRAADIAESVSGVSDVSNQLRVGAGAPTTAQQTPQGVSRRSS